jgi:hypothetical protein
MRTPARSVERGSSCSDGDRFRGYRAALWSALFGDYGTVVEQLTAADAALEIEGCFGVAVDPALAVRVEDSDQWTLSPSMHRHLPAWRINREGTEVHVATRTGAIVPDTTRTERLLARLGPIPHSIYPALLVPTGRCGARSCWWAEVRSGIGGCVGTTRSGCCSGRLCTWAFSGAPSLTRSTGASWPMRLIAVG